MSARELYSLLILGGLVAAAPVLLATLSLPCVSDDCEKEGLAVALSPLAIAGVITALRVGRRGRRLSWQQRLILAVVLIAPLVLGFGLSTRDEGGLLPSIVAGTIYGIPIVYLSAWLGERLGLSRSSSRPA